jgi:hypothetical protein
MKTPEEIAREAEHFRLSMPLAQTVVTLEACLVELIRLLISKRALDAQEVLEYPY